MNESISILRHFIQDKWIENRLKAAGTRENLKAYQEKKLKIFYKNILSQSPFYSQFKGNSLQDYPIITKKDMMAHFSQMNTVGVDRDHAFEVALKAEENRNFSPTIGNISVGLSSGTSGTRGLFLVSPEERIKWAGVLLSKGLPDGFLGGLIQSQRIAFFLRANSNLYTTVSTSHHIQFSFFDLTYPFSDLLFRLNQEQPTIVTAPSSVLRAIAQAQERGAIHINPVKIISVAEVLDPLDQVYITSVFNQPVHQIYQATEGFLGITDRSSGALYLNEAYIHVEKEWVDESSGRFIPIVTDFTRRTQPIVRYRLDDVLIEDKSVTNSPFTVLSAIEGRCDDVCYLYGVLGENIPLFSDAIRQLLASSSLFFKEYTVIQPATGVFDLYLDPYPSEDNKKNLQMLFRRRCQSMGGQIPIVSVLPFSQVFIESQSYLKKRKRIERRPS